VLIFLQSVHGRICLAEDRKNLENLDETLNAAQDFVKAKLYKKAAPLFRKALEIEPKNLTALVGIADIHAREGEEADAKIEYLHAAEAALAQGNLELARSAGERSVQLKSIEAHFVLAQVWAVKSSWDLVVSELEHVTRFKPNHLGALTLMAQAQLKRGKLMEAESSLGKALKADPAHAGALAVQSELNAKRGSKGVPASGSTPAPASVPASDRTPTQVSAPVPTVVRTQAPAPTPVPAPAAPAQKQVIAPGGETAEIRSTLALAEASLKSGALDEAVELYERLLAKFPSEPKVREGLNQAYALIAGGNPTPPISPLPVAPEPSPKKVQPEPEPAAATREKVAESAKPEPQPVVQPVAAKPALDPVVTAPVPVKAVEPPPRVEMPRMAEPVQAVPAPAPPPLPEPKIMERAVEPPVRPAPAPVAATAPPARITPQEKPLGPKVDPEKKARLTVAASSLKAGRLEQAIELYERVLAKYPDDAEAEDGLQKAWHLKVEQEADAAEAARPEPTPVPHTPARRAAKPAASELERSSFLVMANNSLISGKLDESIEFYERLLEKFPGDVEGEEGLQMARQLKAQQSATEDSWMPEAPEFEPEEEAPPRKVAAPLKAPSGPPKPALSPAAERERKSYLAVAENSLNSGLFDEAIELFEHLLNKFPGDEAAEEGLEKARVARERKDEPLPPPPPVKPLAPAPAPASDAAKTPPAKRKNKVSYV
jgi:tetratricopeptide (TPR) repeat protein